MKVKYQLVTTLSLFVFLILITACSGGGGGGGGGTPAQDDNGQPQISGAAVKGIIKNGLVEIFPIVNGQQATEPVATTATGDDGSYEFTLPEGFSGSVMVVVRDNGDSNNPSTMTCDSFRFRPGCGSIDTMGNPQYAFGDDMPLGDLHLKALLANVSGGKSFTAAVTPYTHMAAAYAEQLAADGGYTAEKIAKANSKVGNMLGINNIVATVPPDLTKMDTSSADDTNAVKYALLTAAILSLADDQFSHNVKDVVDVLSTNYADYDGELMSAETANQMNIISLAELSGQATMLSEWLGVESRARNDLRDLNKMALARLDLPTETLPSPTSGLGELEKVKEFVKDIRTWGNVISDDFENFENNNSELQQQLNMAEVTVNEATPLFNEVFDHAINAAVDAYITTTDLDLAVYFAVKSISATGSAIVSDTSVTLNGVIDGVTISFTLVFPPLDGGNIQGTSFTFEMANGSMRNNAIQASIESGSIQFEFSEQTDITPWVNGTYTMDFPDPDSASLNLTTVEIRELGKDNPVVFTGTVSMSIVGSKGGGDAVVRDFLGDVVQYNPESVDLDGTLSKSTNSFNVHIAGSMPNAHTFMPDPNGSEESATNFRELSEVGISFTAKFDGLQEARFSITGNRTGYEDGDVEMKISYGGRSIDVTVTVVNREPSGTITITNQDGVVATIQRNSNSGTGEVVYNGRVYATIDNVNGIAIIRYIDGYFESM